MASVGVPQSENVVVIRLATAPAWVFSSNVLAKQARKLACARFVHHTEFPDVAIWQVAGVGIC